MVNKKIKYELSINEKNLDDFIANNIVKFK